MLEESRRSWECLQRHQRQFKSNAGWFILIRATDRLARPGNGGQNISGIRSKMSIIHPTWSEPVVPGIPDHEIYEDEEED